MKIAIAKERKNAEKRVAASPSTVSSMVNLGCNVVIEAGAGESSFFSDVDYKEAGALIEKDPKKVLSGADIILKVQPPFENINNSTTEISQIKKGAVIIGFLSPFGNKKEIKQLADSLVTSFSMEFVPRITRAQSMDVLSSQSNLAGYKAVLDAVGELNKVVPMMMTAAGTIKPAKVLIMGAGVAGLQAIATAKRLGAIVSAFDVRPVAKEQVESLGAKFIEVKDDESKNAETEGGYAKEMSEEYKKKQAALIEEIVKSQDIVITTALIPGRVAPILITKDMVKSMKVGSVIVDLAVTAGGNCEYSICGKTVKQHDVTIIGHENMPSRLASDASMLYANNILNFVKQIIKTETDEETGVKTAEIVINMEDEIISSSLITHKGKIVHPSLAEAPVKKGAAKRIVKEAIPKKVLATKPHLKKRNTTTKPIKKV